jgi:hypothetical protein
LCGYTSITSFKKKGKHHIAEELSHVQRVPLAMCLKYVKETVSRNVFLKQLYVRSMTHKNIFSYDFDIAQIFTYLQNKNNFAWFQLDSSFRTIERFRMIKINKMFFTDAVKLDSSAIKLESFYSVISLKTANIPFDLLLLSRLSFWHCWLRLHGVNNMPSYNCFWRV